MNRNKIIESNKAVESLRLSGYSCEGCAGNDFGKVYVINKKTGQQYSFPDYVDAKNKLCKSPECSEVLQLMDSEECSENYCKALKTVLAKYPNINRKELEEELNQFI